MASGSREKNSRSRSPLNRRRSRRRLSRQDRKRTLPVNILKRNDPQGSQPDSSKHYTQQHGHARRSKKLPSADFGLFPVLILIPYQKNRQCRHQDRRNKKACLQRPQEQNAERCSRKEKQHLPASRFRFGGCLRFAHAAVTSFHSGLGLCCCLQGGSLFLSRSGILSWIPAFGKEFGLFSRTHRQQNKKKRLQMRTFQDVSSGGLEGDRTLEPHGCEPCALPAELQARLPSKPCHYNTDF